MRQVSDYAEQWKKISRVATRAVVETTWRQWEALGSYAASVSSRAAHRIVDPEGLVLASWAFQEDERRLLDMLRWWAQVGAPLTSVQRMKTLVEELQGESKHHFALFARWAGESGHRSWKRHATSEAGARVAESRGLKGPEELRLIAPSTLMLRMRAAFGVGAKPDVLTFLIGLAGAMAPVSVISRAVGYTETAVREALKDMSLARLVEETTNRPALYRTRHRAWIELLELDAPGQNESQPSWGMWAPLYGLLIAARDLAESTLSGQMGEHIGSSAARDAVERYRYALDFHDIRIPSQDRFPGRQFAQALLEITEAVAEWMETES